MSESSPSLEVAPAQPVFVASLEPLRALSAMADPLRWRILNLLAPGKAMSVTEIAGVLGKWPDSVGKHLRVMRAAGLVSCEPGKDQRYLDYSIPVIYRKEMGLVDYGFCVLRIPAARPPMMKD